MRYYGKGETEPQHVAGTFWREPKWAAPTYRKAPSKFANLKSVLVTVLVMVTLYGAGDSREARTASQALEARLTKDEKDRVQDKADAAIARAERAKQDAIDRADRAKKDAGVEEFMKEALSYARTAAKTTHAH